MNSARGNPPCCLRTRLGCLITLALLVLHDLKVLDLLGTYVTAHMVQLLVQADWPIGKLIALRLDDHALNEAGMQ